MKKTILLIFCVLTFSTMVFAGPRPITVDATQDGVADREHNRIGGSGGDGHPVMYADGTQTFFQWIAQYVAAFLR